MTDGVGVSKGDLTLIWPLGQLSPMLGDQSTMGFPDVPFLTPAKQFFPTFPLKPFPRGSIHCMGHTCLIPNFYLLWVSGASEHLKLVAHHHLFVRIPGLSPLQISCLSIVCMDWESPRLS